MKSIKLFAALVLCFGLFVLEIKAQRKNKKTVVITKSYPKNKKVYAGNKTVVRRNNRVVKYKTVNTYSRNKVIIVRNRRVRTFNTLPFGYNTFAFAGGNYYHHAGFCYGFYNNVYRIRPFPRGFRINVLPIGYHTIIYQGTPRYYYAGTYYTKVDGGYKTAVPVTGMLVPNLPEEDLEEVKIDGESYYEYDDVLYKTIATDTGDQYKVIGHIGD
jgi:hypothetical protein